MNMSPVAVESVLLSMPCPHSGCGRHMGVPDEKSSNELEVHGFRRNVLRRRSLHLIGQSASDSEIT